MWSYSACAASFHPFLVYRKEMLLLQLYKVKCSVEIDLSRMTFFVDQIFFFLANTSFKMGNFLFAHLSSPKIVRPNTAFWLFKVTFNISKLQGILISLRNTHLYTEILMIIMYIVVYNPA